MFNFHCLPLEIQTKSLEACVFIKYCWTVSVEISNANPLQRLVFHYSHIWKLFKMMMITKIIGWIQDGNLYLSNFLI